MPADRRPSWVPGDLTRLLFLVEAPPWLLVPDAAAGSAAALADRLVVFLDRNRLLRQAGNRDIGQVLAHPDQVLLRVPERREERLSGPAQEVDVLPCVRLLLFLAELRRGRCEAELSEHRLLADVDELRGVVFAELDAA